MRECLTGARSQQNKLFDEADGQKSMHSLFQWDTSSPESKARVNQLAEQLVVPPRANFNEIC